jgi:hypothetical protein
MIKRILPLVILLVGTVGSFEIKAQMNYTVSFPTSTFSALTAPITNPTLVNASRAIDGAATADDGVTNGIALPFTFKFNGIDYDRMNICTNGFITLGTTTNNPPLDTFQAIWFNSLSGGPFYYDNSPSNNRPVIAPLWDDLDMQNVTNVGYKVTGTSPNRVLTIQWLNAKWIWNATSAGISFQTRLFETTNVIEFVYRQQAGALSSAGASIGLADVFTGSGNFMSMTGVTNTATASTTNETSINTKPANNFTIRFTPIPLPSFDANLRLFAAPVVSTCETLPISFTYILKNSGSGNIAPGAATVNLDITGPNATSLSASNTKSLAINEFDTIVFNNININNPGANFFTAIVNLASDGRATNDTSRYLYSTATSISTFPAREDVNVLTGFPYLATFNGSQMWRRFSTSGIAIPNNATPLTPLPTSDPADTSFFCALNKIHWFKFKWLEQFAILELLRIA